MVLEENHAKNHDVQRLLPIGNTVMFVQITSNFLYMCFDRMASAYVILM